MRRSTILGSVEARPLFEDGALLGIDGSAAQTDPEAGHSKPQRTALAASEGRYFSVQGDLSAVAAQPAQQAAVVEPSATAEDEEGWLKLAVAAMQTDTSGRNPHTRP